MKIPWSGQQTQRGDVLTTPGYFHSADRLDGKLKILSSAKKPIKNRTRIRFHIGTDEIMARIRLLDKDILNPGDNGYVQFLLEKPIVSNRLEPFVIRSYSPIITIGGGVVLDANATKHKRHDELVIKHLRSLETENPEQVVLEQIIARKFQPISTNDLVRITGLQSADIEDILEKLQSKQQIIKIGTKKNVGYVFHKVVAELENIIIDHLAGFHQKEPWRPGLGKGDLQNRLDPVPERRLFDYSLNAMLQSGGIAESNDVYKLPDHKIRLTAEEEQTRQELLTILQSEGFSTSTPAQLAVAIKKDISLIQKVLGAMQGLGDVIFNDDIYFTMNRVDEAKDKIKAFFQTNDEMSISEFRQMLNTSRKFAFAMISYLDTIGFTERYGDGRRLVKN